MPVTFACAVMVAGCQTSGSERSRATTDADADRPSTTVDPQRTNMDRHASQVIAVIEDGNKFVCDHFQQRFDEDRAHGIMQLLNSHFTGKPLILERLVATVPDGIEPEFEDLRSAYEDADADSAAALRHLSAGNRGPMRNDFSGIAGIDDAYGSWADAAGLDDSRFPRRTCAADFDQTLEAALQREYGAVIDADAFVGSLPG